MRTFFFIVCAVFELGALRAQKEIANQQNTWLMYFGNHRLTDHWGFNTEYQWRRTDGLEQWQQSLLRAGVDFYGKQGLQLTAGYAWIKTFPYGEQPVSHVNDEHRIWQQVLMKSITGRCEIQHRFRLEQRLLENWVVIEDGNYLQDNMLYRQRARYRVMLTVPLSKKQMADKTLFLTASDEVFIGFGKGIAKNVLDQNRLAVALGWRFNAACNIQLGYLNQYIIKKDGIHAERNHTLIVGVTYNLDLRKKQDD